MKSDAISEQLRNLEGRAPTNDTNLLDLFIILSERRRYILLFTVAMAIATLTTVFLIPSEYTATTIVLPPSQSSVSSTLLSQLAGASVGGGAGALASLASGGLGIKNTSEMYVSLLRSRTVEDAVIQRFKLMARYHKKTMHDTRKKFEDRTTVVLGAKDGLIRISVEDRDPSMSAQMANGYVEELRKLSTTLAVTEASQRRLFFQQQMESTKENLTAAEEAMKRTEQTTGVLQIDSQAKALIESAGVLRGQAVAKKVQIQAMRSFATEDNPELIIAKRQLAEIEGQLNKLAGQEPDAFIVSKGRAPEAGMEYLRKLRDVKYNETLFELIAKQLELAKLDEAREGAIIQVADYAVPPDKKSYPHRALLTILMTLVGFIVAGLGAIASHRWGEAQRDPETHRRVQHLRRLLFKA